MSSRSHIYYQDLLEQHVAGEPLSPLDRMEMLDHVEECDDCRGILEAENRITERMKSVPRLVTPSDLRAKILSQAVRDHRERKTTPSEDPAVADLLKARLRESLQNPAAAGPSQKQSTGTPRAPVAPGLSLNTEEFPIFAGVERPRPSRLRQIWRKAAPPLATGFMSVAALAALYSGQFQGVPLAGEAQQLVWAVVQKFQENSDPAPLTDGFADRAVAQAPAGLSQPVQRPRATPQPAQPSQQIRFSQAVFDQSDEKTMAGPLPGTQVVVDWVKRTSILAAAANSTVEALGRAATGPAEVPSPAEEARPQIAALVLWATDRDNSGGGFRESALASELETLARSQPGGHVAQQDQFAHDGHRYRLYTLDLPAGSAQRVVETLTPYEAPADGMIMNALAMQNVHTGLPRDSAAVQYYRSQEAHLCTALQTVRTVPVSHGQRERLRVVLVE